MRIQFDENEFMEDLYQRTKHNWMYSDTKTKKPKQSPDAKKHQIVSFIKSGIRILGYVLIPLSLPWATGILIISELVGIIEELV